MLALTLSTSGTAWATDGIAQSTRNGEPGFWIPRKIWIEAERRYGLYPAVKRLAESRQKEIESLRASNLAYAQTASAAQARAGLIDGAWTRCEEARVQADRDARQAADRGLGAEPVLWLGLGVASCIGAAYALPRR